MAAGYRLALGDSVPRVGGVIPRIKVSYGRQHIPTCICRVGGAEEIGRVSVMISAQQRQSLKDANFLQ